MAQKTTARRGSANLEIKLRKSDIAKLVTLANKKGMAIIDWEELGQPGPDWVRGTFHGRPKAAADLAREIMGIEGVRDLNILIRGTPRPDLAEIRVSMRNAAMPG